MLLMDLLLQFRMKIYWILLENITDDEERLTNTPGGSHDSVCVVAIRRIQIKQLPWLGLDSSVIHMSLIYIGTDKQKFQHKIVITFLPISFNISLGAQKNRLSLQVG